MNGFTLDEYNNTIIYKQKTFIYVIIHFIIVYHSLFLNNKK